MPSAGSRQTGCRLTWSAITTPPSFNATANLVVVGSTAMDGGVARHLADGRRLRLRSTTRATSSLPTQAATPFA